MKSSPERDAAVERLLRQTLRLPDDARLMDSCVDPETLSAWAEGGLSQEALEVAGSHVAGCARCQAVLGTLTRINAALPSSVEEKASRGWLGWLVPLTATAVGVTAVALWVTLPRNPRTPLTQGNVPQSPSSAAGAVIGGPNPGEPQSPAVGAETREAARTDSAEARTQQALRRDAAGFETKAATAQTSLPAGVAAAEPPSPAERRVAAADSLASAKTVGVEILSSDPTVRWRIVGAVVQRSTNGGASWATVSVGFQGQLTAGSAPSASVCWFVGGGMVLLSTDGGANWRRIAFPEPTDLSAVRASDARTASVTTVDGRTFATNDGGVTWVSSTPQDF